MIREIVLASASKRRSQILKSCNIRHRAVASRAKEPNKGGSIFSIVKTNARRKALKVLLTNKKSVIIGADTLVRLGKELIGKPKNKKQAKGLLKKFSGRRLEVVTGLFVIDGISKKSSSGCEKSELFVREMSPSEIDAYFKALKPYDKAGGFSIEGAGSFIFDDIRGSYFNILGLPMARLHGLFKEIGLSLLFDF